MDEEKKLAEAMRLIGRRLGKTYGSKGAATTNAKLTTAQRRKAGKKSAASLTPEQRQARAKRAGSEAAATLTPDQRSERARAAAAARWAKKKKGTKHVD
jgi:hypothetical protein